MTAIEFLENLPAKVPAAALEGVSTVFHFEISGDGGGQRTVSVEGQQLKVEAGLNGSATCVVKADADDFMKVIRGDINPMMAVMTGKIKISNVGEMMKYAKMFGLG